MTIIVFLIDTSASMSQRAYLGGRPTLLDVAKGAVETFVKVRQRSPESRGDRYMLLTFEEPPHNIKAGWKENLGTFMNELKNLQCQGMTMMGAALKHAFDVLNINRMQTGIDTYGLGRCPFYLEPSVIVVITDGGKLSNTSGVQDEFVLPMHSPIPGCELTREPFRWDQRLFSLVLRLSGTPAVERDVGLVPSDSSPIDAMCEVTGGRSYSVTSHRMLMQCIDSLVQKVQSGVVINFEKIGPDPPPINGEDGPEGETGSEDARHTNQSSLLSPSNTAWQTCRKLIYVPRSAQKGFPVGFWPIPESFWPDLTANTLPPRSAHPNVKFTCTSQEPMVIENLPFDKSKIKNPLLLMLIFPLQVFVPNSYKNSEVGHPFGYLKASTNLSCVNLFVMPYNYPVLLPLLDELFKVHRQKHTPVQTETFLNYLKTMPSYYATPLRRALTRMGATGGVAQNLVPDNLDNSLSYSVLNYLKRLKNQAKIEFEKLCNEVSSKQLHSKSNNPSGTLEGVRVQPRSPIKRDLLSHPMLHDKFQSLRDQLNEFGGYIVGVSRHRREARGQSYRNAFDIPRKNLLDQILRMRANFLNPSHTKLYHQDVVHSMPISQMGNYQEHLKTIPAQLREVESAPVRQHMFGNPFKIDKRMMVDEADIDLVGGGTGGGRGHKRAATEVGSGFGQSGRPNKRKPGPLPKEFKVKRPSGSSTPTSSPASSARSSPERDYLEDSIPESPGSLLVVATPPASPLPQLFMYSPPKILSPRSPSPPAEFAPPVLQPYDGALPQQNNLNNINSGSGGPAPPRLVPSYSVTPPVSPPLLLPVPDHPSPPPLPPPNAKTGLADIRKHNLKIRAAAYREVRRPGRNYEPLFEHLGMMKGTTEIKINLIKEVINESLRFKRRTLASHLDKQLKALISTTTT
uniref:VWFA domain-containing protein n=1 Tax=Rhodnius prolixus TaxID=13249 RepID=T1HK58_RHOPR